MRAPHTLRPSERLSMALAANSLVVSLGLACLVQCTHRYDDDRGDLLPPDPEADPELDPLLNLVLDPEPPPESRADRPRQPTNRNCLDQPDAGPAVDDGQPPLYLCYEGRWYTIDQDEFVIGRGSKFSDLPIADANISRRHCAVVRRDGRYYMKDLGSTNGIEYEGQRVDDRLIEHDDVFYIAGHRLRFAHPR